MTRISLHREIGNENFHRSTSQLHAWSVAMSFTSNGIYIALASAFFIEDGLDGVRTLIYWGPSHNVDPDSDLTP